MYLVGSRAMAEYIPHSFKDTDIVCSEEELNSIFRSFEEKDSCKEKNIEFIDINLLNNKDVSISKEITIDTQMGHFKVGIPPLEYLYAIKRSHIHRPLAFAKHIIHMHKIKELIGPLSPECSKFLKVRTALTKEKFPVKTPSLYKSNEEFFDDYVKKQYVHDDIHKIVAFGPEPVYEKMKRDFSLAKCEKDMWETLPHNEKIWCVQEEAMVIALERFIIPGTKLPQKIAYYKAVEKICTTLTSGWFRDFAIDNWPEVVREIPDYVNIFNLRKGELRNYEHSAIY